MDSDLGYSTGPMDLVREAPESAPMGLDSRSPVSCPGCGAEVLADLAGMLAGRIASECPSCAYSWAEMVG